MQISNNEELTTDEKRMIDALSAKKVLALMHYCANEKLALATIDEYRFIMGGKRRTLYKAAKDDKKMKFELAGHVFLAINDK